MSWPAVRAGFLVPGEAIVDPWSAPHAYLLQALANGATLLRGCEVTGGGFDGGQWRLETTRGAITVRIYREWAPMGVYRFYNLARNGYYDGSRFFRVLPGFVAQFGLSGIPEADQVWNALPMPDDPPTTSTERPSKKGSAHCGSGAGIGGVFMFTLSPCWGMPKASR